MEEVLMFNSCPVFFWAKGIHIWGLHVLPDTLSLFFYPFLDLESVLFGQWQWSSLPSWCLLGFGQWALAEGGRSKSRGKTFISSSTSSLPASGSVLDQGMTHLRMPSVSYSFLWAKHTLLPISSGPAWWQHPSVVNPWGQIVLVNFPLLSFSPL